MPLQNVYVLEFLILLSALLRHIVNAKKTYTQRDLQQQKIIVSNVNKESKLLYNNSNLNLINFNHVLNISLVSNEREIKLIKFRHLPKLKNLISNFT